jgi:hypothetical protein
MQEEWDAAAAAARTTATPKPVARGDARAAEVSRWMTM